MSTFFIILLILSTVIGGSVIVYIGDGVDKLFGLLLVLFGGMLLTGAIQMTEKNKAAADAEVYKKAIYHNPYEAKILYQLQEDSTLVPMDTIYQLKK